MDTGNLAFAAATAATDNQRIARDLAEQGLSIIDGYVEPLLVARLLGEARVLARNGQLRPAAIGRGEERRVIRETRGDRVAWLDPARSSDAQRQYLERLEALRQELNRMLFLGLFAFEGHLACYPPGSFYRRHLDQFRDAPARRVTCILYLNQDWQPADGGQLRIYHGSHEDEVGRDLLPEAGRLVCFLSDRFPHQVLPARRERFSLTGWFKVREQLPF